MNTFDLFSLKGKTALITGGRAMYGKGATLALADAGADIYLASHSIESAQEFVEALKREKGVKVAALPFEQGDIDSIRNLVDTVIQKAGRIDVFINCSRILPQGDGGVGWFQDEKQRCVYETDHKDFWIVLAVAGCGVLITLSTVVIKRTKHN